MHKLTGLDEMFLSVDAAATTNAVMGGLVIYERPRNRRAARENAMVERITERLDLLPPLRWKLAKVPFGLDHAYWAEVKHVEVADHVRTISLAKPGTDQELAAQVAAIMETPLPFDRPVWELVVIEGLAGGRIAHLLRIHHGVVDGSTVPHVLDILSDDPTEDLGFQLNPHGAGDLVGGRLGMLGRGLVGTAVRPVKLLGLQARTLGWLAGRVEDDGFLAGAAFMGRLLPGELGGPVRSLVNRRQRAAEKPEVQPLIPTLRKPATPINGKVEAGRSYAFSDLPLADFKKVGKAFGATLNDVVLAVVAGALRRYLEENGGIPEKPLVVCIPASLRQADEDPSWGNNVSMFFAELPTDVEDPIDRIREAHTRVAAAKSNFEALPTHLIKPASDFIPMALWSVPQRLLSKAPGWVPTSQWNVVVSNVRGPANPISVTGATIAGYWPAAFLTMGVGLNVTLQSYTDHVDFGFMGATNLTGDLWDLPDHMAAELADLLEAAAAEQGTTAAEN